MEDINDVYYKIYLNRDSKATVVCMQWFDEYDYNPKRFFKDDEDNHVKFDKKEDAIRWLNRNVREDAIDSKYLDVNRFLKKQGE